eukprot:TRINITY_DN46907_c0_g1_i1.p1 TRINITY_DN46907_c0_g1~~TRINITY_DN46907_c0_g1_i1.p1  ORF type:complete len:895 (-),score=73.23 TRINITY_DN46907_c0_g1_i1:74-2701(-)
MGSRRLALIYFVLSRVIRASLPPEDNQVARDGKWVLHAGSGRGPFQTLADWVNAFKSLYPDEVDFTIASTGSDAAKSALYGEIDCLKFALDAGLCRDRTANFSQFGIGGGTFKQETYDSNSLFDLQLLPVLAGPIVLVYDKSITGNLGSTSDARLNMTMRVVGDVFAGNIVYWDDPALQTLNPAISLPHERMRISVRKDKSGMTEALTRAIAHHNPWWTTIPGIGDASVGRLPTWPIDNYTANASSLYHKADGQAGIVVHCLRTPFSLGYVDLTESRRLNEYLGSVHIVNSFSQKPVAPSITATSNAMDAYASEFSKAGSNMAVSPLDPKLEEAYPITRFMYWYVKKSAVGNGNCYRTWLLVQFIRFCFSSGAQEAADRNGWVLPPPSVRLLVESILDTIKCVDPESRQDIFVKGYTPARYRARPGGQFIKRSVQGQGVDTGQPTRVPCLAGSVASKYGDLCDPGTFTGARGNTTEMIGATSDESVCPSGWYGEGMQCHRCSAFHTTRSLGAFGAVLVIACVSMVLVILGAFCVSRNYIVRESVRFAQAQERTIREKMRAGLSTVRELGHPMVLLVGSRYVCMPSEQVLHEDARDLGILTVLDTIDQLSAFHTKGYRIIFFSYQWLSWSRKGPNAAQRERMRNAVRVYCQMHKLSLDEVYVWLDILSIPQCHAGIQTLAVNSLYAYATAADALIIIAPTSFHENTKEVADLESYKSRVWTRVEQLAHCAAHGLSTIWVAERDRLELVSTDWVQDIVCIFDAQMTCCRKNHVGSDRCDKESLVLPLLGLWYSLATQKRIMSDCMGEQRKISQPAMDLFDIIKAKKERVFPRTFDFVTEEGSEKRNLFGDLIDRVDAYVSRVDMPASMKDAVPLVDL